MAIVHVNKTVAATATALTTLNDITEYTSVYVQNNDSAAIYVGDNTIATSGSNKGHVVAAGATFEIRLRAKDTLYAISSAGTAANAVSVLYSQV